MDEVSEFFKSGFLGLYKNTVGKNYQQKTVKDRVSNFNNMRRETRSTLMLLKRQIDENITMTPSNTTEPSRIIKQTNERKDKEQSNNRLEMLRKWKIEKEKRKLVEKKKAKPLFKVCHVPNEIGLPNLENINKYVKGKPIKTNVVPRESKFAPPNHKFHPPKGIKPIHMNSANNSSLSTKSKHNLHGTLSNCLEENKLSSKVARKESSVQRRNTRATSRNPQIENLNKAENNKNPHSKMGVTKNNFTSTNTKQKTASSKIETKTVKRKLQATTLPCIKVESKSISGTEVKRRPGKSSVSEKKISNKNQKEAFVEEHSGLNKLSKLSQKPIVKTVGWNCKVVIGDESLPTGNENIKTPKAVTKKYKKTPKRIHKLDMSDVEFIDVCNNAETKRSELQSIPKNIMKVRRRLTKNNPNSELKGLDELDQIESDSKNRNSTVGSATGSASPDYPIDKNLTDLNSCFYTPQKNNTCEDSPVYISPFVTVSRGKSSARKEYHMRHSGAERAPEFVVDILNSTSPKAGADYFEKKLNSEVNRIERTCDMWENYKNSNELSEEANDMINVAIGQSKLLISKKFEQFRSLIEQCRTCKYAEKPISCEDLHGFWDMIYMQVEDLNKRFNNLNVLKANNWQEIVPEKKIVTKRGRGRPKKASASSTLKNLIKAARDMKKSDTESEINLNVPPVEETKEFDGGYYTVKSPVRTLNDPLVLNENARRSLRVSLLTNQAKKRRSSSQGLTMMKVSQAIKHGDGVTPSKSILKNDLSKLEKRMTKSVLFKDDIEEDVETKLVGANEELYDDKDAENNINKENSINEINLISFSPITPTRRSKRLNKVK
ncbi:guanylate kinase-associated protein mars-like [Anoplophora glabripennis]|uniref:guanylate kinase-associated protein mars-like n=1 Tax=Anoplophora glabripennis TaxID=217634 RepID=UPI000873D474|nr:guanylate kinase-associated protein mars-like [Anoplophora glabripennis]